MHPNEIADNRTDLLTFTKTMFKARKGQDFIENWHHAAICAALERVVIGQTKRLIINIPPRYSKTEIAVINFMAWCMGNFPDSEFIHASYSSRLAANNSYQCRAVVQSETYAEIFPSARLMNDSKARDEWRTTDGGCVYATGAEGTITGYGAGKLRDYFGGCFPHWQEVETENGPTRIGDIVGASLPTTKVFAFDESRKKRGVHDVVRFWENPANDIIRVVMSDGSYFDCTPDHEVLTKSGWVAAVHLANALNLVDGKSCNLGGGFPAQAPVFSDVNDAISVLWLCVPYGVRQSIRDRFPCLSELDLPDDPDANPVLFSNRGRAIGALEYLNDLFSGKLGSGSTLHNWESPMAQSILHVIGLSAIREISKGVIGGISIQMSDLIPLGAFTYKLLCDQMSDVFKRDISANGKIDAHVSPAVTRGLKRSDGLCPSDLTAIRDLIKPAGSGDVFPVNVLYVGHVDKTFCLEVGGVHNFELSHTGAIVSNCIIIDDPHKAGEASSDTMRQNVLDWFQTTIESRCNSPDTPIIVIMQRLHEEDLTGWLLNGGNGEKWEHLCIPVLDADDNPLWPFKHDREALQRMESSNRYVFTGQYMQRPSPLGGGIIKSEWFGRYTIPPKIKYRKIYADTAQKTAERNDYSVFECWGHGEDNRIYLLDMVRGKWEAPELKRRAVEFWNKHAQPSHHGALRKMIVEDKASGTGLIQDIKHDAKIPVQAQQRNKDKLTRVMDVTSYIESGYVMIPADAPFTSDFVSECEGFTADDSHMHDDQIDPMCDAINDMLIPDGEIPGMPKMRMNF